MAWVESLAFFSIICLWQTSAVTVKSGVYELKTMGKGEVMATNNKGQIKIKFMSLEEKDENGQDVPANASINPHKVTGLDMKDFMETKSQFHNSSAPDHYSFSMTRTLMLKEANATLKVDIKVAVTNGTVQGYKAADKFNVMPGTVLLAVTLQSWPFCGGQNIAKCKNSNGTVVNGKYLDLKLQFGQDITFKKVASGYKSDQVMLQLAAKSAVDANVKDTPGYPKVMGKDIHIRFFKFMNAEKAEFKYIQLDVYDKKTSGADNMMHVAAITLSSTFLALVVGLIL